LALRYNSIDNAANSKSSGSKANGPRPNAVKPKALINNGFAVRVLKRKTSENIISPNVNCERVFLYMSMYVVNKKTNNETLTVETTV
jgi:hypothetical protein